MSGDVLYILILRDHVQLWQNSKSLKPDRKSPENPIHGEIRMHYEPKNHRQKVQPIMWESVGLMIVALHREK